MASMLARIIATLVVIFTMSTPLAYGQELGTTPGWNSAADEPYIPSSTFCAPKLNLDNQPITIKQELGASAWNSGCNFMPKLQDDSTEANAPAETAGFVAGSIYEGVWATPGFPNLPSQLRIKSVDSANAMVRYQWGDEDNGGHVTVPATILPDGSLTWGGANNSPKFTFRLNDDGNLNGLREVQAGKSEVTMTKVSDAG